MTVADTVTGRRDEHAARELLARVKVVVQPALDAALGRVSPGLADSLGYHFAGGGKYVRAALVLHSASATGADGPVALDGAAAIELIHNFSLIHDDIMDNDTQRRHRQSVWALYGVGEAMIAGDALSTLAFQLLLADPTAPRVAAAARLADATQDMIRGQAEDLAAEGRSSLTVEEWLSMADGKTAALLSCACALGATLAEADEPAVAALSEFGRHVGLAFQAVDDVLGVWGEPERTGKPTGNDLRRRKKTLPVSFAYARGVDVFGSLGATGDRELTDDEVAEATAQLEECGARDETMTLSRDQLGSALRALDRVTMSESARGDLVSIARYVVGRDQ